MHDQSSTAIRVFLCALATLAALLARVGPSDAGDGAQFSRDCTSTYVNKKVGDTEQWAITWEIYGNVTGNVVDLDGGAPSLIECALVSEDGSNEVFDCYGSDACASAPCGGSQWSLIEQSVSIPLSFFLPSGVDPLSPLDSCTPAT
jgi:hypothetical protein